MSFEANKIAAALLVAIILAMVSGILADHLIQPVMLAKNVYQVAGSGTANEAETAAAKPAGPEPIGPLLASASVAAGKSDTTVCTACHTFDKGQPNRIGPNLYGIMGDQIAHDRGNFDFSTALKTAGAGKTWTPDLLNEWLFKPQSFARGTKMTYVGQPKTKTRADIIAYLNSLSDHPKPLEAAPAAAAAPAKAGAPAAPAKAGTPAAPAKPGAPAAPSTPKPGTPGKPTVPGAATPAPAAAGAK